MEICIRENYLDKVSLTKTYIVIDENGVEHEELKYNREELVKPPYFYQIVEVDDKYEDCVYSDFDYINDKFVFNPNKYNARKEKENADVRIEELKRLLAKYDYIGVKIATGRATKEEYAKEIAQMTEWANEINELEQCKAEVKASLNKE